MKNQYENFFINFANKNRLKIIILLAEKSLNVSQIVKETGEEQSAVSHNLRMLALCKIVNIEKKGKERIYSLNKKLINSLFKIVDEHVSCNCGNECNKYCKMKNVV
jgi:DNA-binding transcriptional ArsR family regulator